METTHRELTTAGFDAEMQSVLNQLQLQKFALDEHAIVASTDPSGVITYVNDKFCQISKYSRDELIGQTHGIINSGQHPKPFFVEMWKTISSGRTWHGEICNKAKDNTLYWVNTTIVPFHDEHGKITSYTAIRADISERKATELKLEVANVNLRKTNEELEQFIYTVSHDLKSPIVTLQGYLSLLRTDIANERYDRFNGCIDRLDAASVKLKECVNDLLELSRVGYGASDPVDIDMKILAAKILHLHELEIRELGFEVMVEDTLPTIRFDAQQMEEILDNLVTNAMKYGSGAPSPVLKILGQEKENEFRICVRDNGNGIDPRYQEKVFKIFERLDTTKSGNGIGLSIVKKMVENVGGRVWIDSQPGEGTAFWLSIPRIFDSACMQSVSQRGIK